MIYTNPETGEKHVVSVRIWNETVSNLTLMALGSSAPEILLSVIEIIGNNFKAGDLGPGTIVGSAAFNLFCIIAICVIVIPTNEIRKIRHLRVFVCTASFSVFAYIWLYLIISVITPEKVDVWEAVITFAFFPVLVILAYITDKQLIWKLILGKRYIAEKVEKFDNDVEMQAIQNNQVDHVATSGDGGGLVIANDKALAAYHGEEVASSVEQNKRDYIKKLEELRKSNPEWSESKVAHQAALEILASQQKSRAYYRVAATRKMTGSGNVLRKNLEKKVHDREAEVDVVIVEDESFTRVCFEPSNYTVMENVGTFEVNVQRITATNANLDFFTYVDFKTVDGTAKRDTDFQYIEGTLTFAPKEESKKITINVIDDEDFEEDEHFKVVLSNVRNSREKDGAVDKQIDCQLSEKFHEATVIILDDDHQGVFTFDTELVQAHENLRSAELKVSRLTGARGEVHVPFRTLEGSAKPGIDYEEKSSEIIFLDNETSKTLKISVVDKEEYSRNETFGVELGTPKRVKVKNGGNYVYEDDFPVNQSQLTDAEKIALQGRPKLGAVVKCWVTIIPSKEMKNVVDQLMKDTNMGEVLSTSSWRDQFNEAITISAGDDDESGYHNFDKNLVIKLINYYIITNYILKNLYYQVVVAEKSVLNAILK